MNENTSAFISIGDSRRIVKSVRSFEAGDAKLKPPSFNSGKPTTSYISFFPFASSDGKISISGGNLYFNGTLTAVSTSSEFDETKKIWLKLDTAAFADGTSWPADTVVRLWDGSLTGESRRLYRGGDIYLPQTIIIGTAKISFDYTNGGGATSTGPAITVEQTDGAHPDGDFKVVIGGTGGDTTPSGVVAGRFFVKQKNLYLAMADTPTYGNEIVTIENNNGTGFLFDCAALEAATSPGTMMQLAALQYKDWSGTNQTAYTMKA